MKTKFLLIVLGTVALAIAFAVRATRQINEAKTATAALVPQRAALRASIGGLEQRLHVAKDVLTRTGQNTATQQGERGTTVAAAATSGNEAPTKSKAPARRFSPETVIANDPQKLAEYSKNFCGGLDLTYGGMFKALHLSPEQIEKFKDLQVWEEQRRLDLRAAAETQGLDRLGGAYDQLLDEQHEIQVKKEAELFGSGPLLDQYREYRSLGYLRETAQRLGSSEVYPDAPVTSV